MTLKQTILPNGLRVITIKRPHTLTAAVRIYVRAGSRYDQSNLGSAHFVEHMLFHGTVNRNSRQIYNEIENLGGVIEAGTTREYSTFYLVLMSKYLKIGVDVLADIILNSTFDKNAYLHEKLVILEEIRRSQDRSSFIWGFFLQNLWSKTSLKNPILGEIESLRVIKQKDLLEFYHKHYVAKNMVISVCGDIEHQEVISLISDRFSTLLGGEELHPPKTVEPGLDSARRLHLKKDVHQTHMIMGVPAVSMKAKDKYAVKLLDKILGTGGSCRLFQSLREEKKLVYSIYSQAPTFEDRGYFAVYTAFSPEKVEAVEELIVEEWDRLRTDLVSEEELQRAKRSYEGIIAREFETNLATATIFGIEALLYRVEPFEECLRRSQSVDRNDILKAANKYLHPNRYLLVTVGRK